MTGEQISEAQRRIRLTASAIVVPRLRSHYRAIARWWELEAMRGYVGVVDEGGANSSDRSRRYASNYRWLVELMDNGQRVSADARGVYVNGELATAYMARQIKAARPPAPRRKRGRHARR